MCGIFGTVNYASEQSELVFRDLHHRGPDAHGFWEANGISLWHTRLAIQGVGVGGHQPMQHGGWVVGFNGEIYNHHELRQRYGLCCQSGSDTETLLHLWARLGVAMLPELDGMFAFALFDTVNKRLWLVRDRFGEKPLYVWQTEASLVFSSELRLLQRHVPVQLDRLALSRYCQLGYFFREETPYRNVRSVLPGHILEICIRTGACVETCWCAPKFESENADCQSGRNTLSVLDQVVTQAICQRIDTAEREVGVLLSGGIDSGLVTAIAARHRPGIRTFTMAFANGSYDEAPLAKLVAAQYKTHHTEVRPAIDNLADEVLTILPRYGEPFMDSSALPCYWVAKAAREHVPVVLTGDGADELFGGYRRYIAARLELHQGVAGRLLSGLCPLIPYPQNKRSAYAYLYRLADLARQSGSRRYLSATTDVLGDFASALRNPADLSALENLIEQTAGWSELKQLQWLDRTLLLPGDLLRKMDIASMAHSLEVRNPFLSNAVADLALQLSDTQKIGWRRAIPQTKTLLRRLARVHLPATLVNQPKRGFEVPLRQWVDGPLRTLVHDYLNTPAFVDELIEPTFIRDLLNHPQRFPAQKRAKMLWMMLSVEIWYRNLFHHE